MNHRHIHFILFLFAITALACKKESSEKPPEDNTHYYIKAKIDGQWVEFPDARGHVAPIQNYESVKTLITYAWTADSTRTFSFVISADGEEIKPGVYHNEMMDDDSTVSFDTQYFGLPSNRMWRGGATLNNTKSTYIFNITAISDKVIAGHFEGDFAMDLFDPNDRVQIPEGEFYIRRVPFN